MGRRTHPSQFAVRSRTNKKEGKGEEVYLAFRGRTVFVTSKLQRTCCYMREVFQTKGKCFLQMLQLKENAFNTRRAFWPSFTAAHVRESETQIAQPASTSVHRLAPKCAGFRDADVDCESSVVRFNFVEWHGEILRLFCSVQRALILIFLILPFTC